MVLATAPLLPLVKALLPPPFWGCEERHHRFHAPKGVHESRLLARGLP